MQEGGIKTNFIWDKLTEWLKEMLVDGVMDALTGLFDNVNEQIAGIAGNVGATPQAWNGTIFGMVRNLSDNVVVPLAGMILALVATLELIQLLIDRNNMHDFDVFLIYKWAFKTAASVLIVSNTWNIVMGIFEATQSIVGQASGVITGSTNIGIDSAIADLEARLTELELGELFSLWIQSNLISVTMWALTICIFIITYGRMIEIYLVASVAPIPMAMFANKEWGQIGTNYLRSLFALGLQAVLIMICVAIYAILIRNIAAQTDITKAIWTCIGYTVLLCFSLFKTSSLAKSILSAH